MKILFAASEALPFAASGGLADVVGALPKSLNHNEYDVRVVIPNYTCIPWEYRSQFRYVSHFYMDYGRHVENVHVGIMEYVYEGVHFYFIDNEYYFKCDRPYSDSTQWDIERFIFFSKAVLAAMPVIGFHPDIIHCHDWQTGMIPVFLKSTFATHSFYWGTKSIMTIHNLKFQGVWDIRHFVYNTNLPDYMFTPDKLEFKSDANMLKGGLVYADYITTVSETYAEEIKTPYYGEQLDGLLCARSRSLRGILNGIDMDANNPATDPYIPFNYSIDNFEEGKAKCKEALQDRFGLNKDGSPVFGMVSRMVGMKGFDLVQSVADGLVDRGIELVILGSGESQYENFFSELCARHPGRVGTYIGFEPALSQEIYAGADAFIMPSKSEPCGLAQMVACRYGTPPIVRETGGLRDSIHDSTMGDGNGFTFAGYSAHELYEACCHAQDAYNDKKNWHNLVRHCMECDFSWDVSAKSYEGLYNETANLW